MTELRTVAAATRQVAIQESLGMLNEGSGCLGKMMLICVVQEAQFIRYCTRHFRQVELCKAADNSSLEHGLIGFSMISLVPQFSRRGLDHPIWIPSRNGIEYNQ